MIVALGLALAALIGEEERTEEKIDKVNERLERIEDKIDVLGEVELRKMIKELKNDE